MREIDNAVADWNRYTCIQLRRATGQDRNKVRVENGNG